MKNLKKLLWVVFAVIVVFIAVLPLIVNKEVDTLDEETRIEAPGEFVNLDQGITHYEEAGLDTARTVLLVHGFSVPYYIWDPTFEALKNSGFHVIRFDLFGRGYSDRPNLLYNRDLFTKQIADLLNALNIENPIDIVGLSMGGPIVAQFTDRYPEKVNKVILIDPLHEAVNISVLKYPVIGEYLMNVYFAQSMKKKQLNDFYRPENFPDWPAKFLVQMNFKGFKRAILSSLRNYMSEDKLADYIQLGQLQKQVLLIWGEDDKTLPFEGNERIREVVECEFMSVKEAGHLPHMEHPELVHTKIIDFLHK